MAAINDLISQIKDEELRNRIQAEVNKLSKQKKFGLVFEDHVPECTPLYDVPVQVGRTVAVKDQKITDIYAVTEISDGIATCVDKTTKAEIQLPVESLVSVAEFGEAIYPYLKPIDSVCNAPDSDLWHTLIEADNYHALQLLEYLYAGKVDCIYIDPPYNTGARDWKYNNDYVDSSDSYRHSKWLSMMEKRLKLAKKLLNPADSVLICTIDEKEYLHLGCLLEELFPEARMQMVSSVINVKGTARDRSFSRMNEYLFFLQNGQNEVDALALNDEWRGNIKKSTKDKVRLAGLMRTGTGARRNDSPGCFYPIIFDKDGNYLRTGEAIPLAMKRQDYKVDSDEVAVWPIHTNGEEGCWMYRPDGFINLVNKGYVFFGKMKNSRVSIMYAPKGVQKKIESGEFSVDGYNSDGSAIINDNNYSAKYVPGNQWFISSHNAIEYGSKLLKDVIGETRFTFPKSLYAVHDAIRFFVANKPNALILDFFAGSGTTLHAVNLLNAEDGGHRRCIMVTNNEVSDSEAKSLTKQGYKPGDPEWEKLGIARYVTWPRTVCSIEGHDVNDKPLKGTYLGSEREMAEGFPANAAFFKLGFLDKGAVALGRQFKELLPVLWMKAGCIGPCPTINDEATPDMLVLPENDFAVLTDETQFSAFIDEVNKKSEIHTVFIVTDSTGGFREMANQLHVENCYQLYRDYLDNFRINTGR
ncbi:MAG: DNA methyltransferase [Dialister sp.]|nr:DNA methyltransferase [Dialister sp.]